MASGGASLGKRLAASDKRVRDKALASVRLWLKTHRTSSELDLLKLWKALFYCMWMSDKVPVQQELAQQLAELIHVLQPEQAMLMLQVFLLTMQREWPGLDKFRVDKYLSLIRKAVHESFVYLRKHAWSDDVVSKFVAVLEDPGMSNPPKGIRYQLVEVFVPELIKAAPQIETAALMALLEPLMAVAAGSMHSVDKSLSRRVLQDVLEPLVTQALETRNSQVDDEADTATGSGKRRKRKRATPAKAAAPKGPFANVDVTAILQRIFDAAAAKDTSDRQRSRLYALHKQLHAKCSEVMEVPEPKLSTSSDDDTKDDSDDSSDVDMADVVTSRSSKAASARAGGGAGGGAGAGAGAGAQTGKRKRTRKGKRKGTEADAATNGDSAPAAPAAQRAVTPSSASKAAKTPKTTPSEAAGTPASSTAKKSKGKKGKKGKAHIMIEGADDVADVLAAAARPKKRQRRTRRGSTDSAGSASEEPPVNGTNELVMTPNRDATKGKKGKKGKKEKRRGAATPSSEAAGGGVPKTPAAATAAETPRSVRFRDRLTDVRVLKKSVRKIKTPKWASAASPAPTVGVLKRTSQQSTPSRRTPGAGVAKKQGKKQKKGKKRRNSTGAGGARVSPEAFGANTSSARGAQSARRASRRRPHAAVAADFF